MRKILLISLSLLLLAVALPAQMQMKHHAMPKAEKMRSAHPMAACMEELKLTDAQMKKFQEARTTFQKQENTITAEIRNLRMDVAEAMQSENIKRVKELNQQIVNKQLQLKNARVDLMAAHMKELTKEQKELMKKNMPMMMGMGAADNPHQFRSARGNRRAPGMGERKHECDDCDDCDGERKFKNRK
ncbi:MAG: Spy/CpxP family protein refolding chaperone [Candidatus Cloacimonetes bacterium]|nr:Spy/CpxP family protein refolding chaperone [Candidatus Cloacimonadota bacterium]MDD3578245.1 Spy/CpxP family protein refolding chaperone [Candidatus Cloacimonadota bacterium]MDD4035433.1 Spy/CpxP family protein refolding chaperone [Candidatus Cloacimonadota bacterium]HPF08372.1 Spy/CpxP family protein refolding chaperone [Candidatus Cloacimonadota bacterium]